MHFDFIHRIACIVHIVRASSSACCVLYCLVLILVYVRNNVMAITLDTNTTT